MTHGHGLASVWWGVADGPGGRQVDNPVVEEPETPDPEDPGTGLEPPTWATSRKVWSAQFIQEAYGVCTQPHRLDMEYAADAAGNYSQAAVDAMTLAVANMGTGGFTPFIRGRYVPPNASGNQQARAGARFQARCRALGIKVLWTLMQESDNATSTTDAEIRTDIQNMSENAADITLAVEGINEPNHNRGAGSGADTTRPVDPEWASISVQRQATLWRSIKSYPNLAHVKVLGPSLHDNANDNSYKTTGIYTAAYHEAHGGRNHMHQIVDLGVAEFLDYAGLHSYAGRGRMPVYNLSGRVGRIDAAFGSGQPIWVTEHGYTNAIEGPDGHAVATEEAAQKYGPRALFQFVCGLYSGASGRDMRYTYFELLDNYDPGAADNTEARFGMRRVGQASREAAFTPSNQTNKPIYTEMQSLFATMGDNSGAAYSPRNMRFGFRPTDSAVTDPQFVLWQKRDGTVMLSAWREVEVMNITTKANLNPAAVDVEIWDGNGTRTIQVDEWVRHWEVARP